MSDEAASLLISVSAQHRVRTAMAHDDCVGWVVSGRKQLITPQGLVEFAPGQVFLLARGTQWEVVNDPAPQGRYIARLLSVAPPLVSRFHAQFAQFSNIAPLQGHARLNADPVFCESFMRAANALEDDETSVAMRTHRVLELLLLLAEQQWVFAPAHELGWTERVGRLVAQRPHASWSVDEVARAFHLSASSLQRRLAEERTSASECVREVRMGAALSMLQSTALQVSEIASRCGYASHSRFSAAFRDRFGFSPSHLRA